MERNIPITIVCRPRRGGEKLIIQANDASSSIAASIKNLLILHQNIFPGEVSYHINHVSNDKEFCYQYNIKISTEEVHFIKHLSIISGFLNAISGLIRNIVKNLDDSDILLSINNHMEEFINRVEIDEEIQVYIVKYKKILQNMSNALKKASIHVEVLFFNHLRGITSDFVDNFKKYEQGCDNQSQKTQIPLFGKEKPSEVEEDKIIYKQEEERKYIENFDIIYKAEQNKPGMITVNPYLRGKRIIIETDPRINNRIVDDINEHLSRKPLKISMDIEKSPTNTYKAYDIINSEDEIR